MTIEQVLIVDDEPMIRSFLAETLKGKKIEVTLAENGKEAIDLIKREHFDLILSDMKMPGKSGMDVLKFTKALSPSTVVILMTAYASVESAVEAMRQGAFNYLIKPFSAESVEALIEKAEEHTTLVEQNKFLKQEISVSSVRTSTQVVAASDAMKKILTDIQKIASSSASVFITGESGTGKEVVACAIHHLSLRKEKPFIKVNCAALPESLIESEFFGHEKGAFTGAFEKRSGRFELAHEGTLLLDEITEVPLRLQSKLLRAIQEQEFERVGSARSIHVDVRFIATSNRNIAEAIGEKIFREDLYYRLNVIPVHIPPLRERREDIPPLAEHFLERFAQESKTTPKRLTADACEKLLSHSWPGNVRELANILERAHVMDRSELITEDDLSLSCANTQKKPAKKRLIALHEIEKEHILEVLAAFHDNRTHAAKALGISVRTLRNKLFTYGLMPASQSEQSLFE